MHDDKPTSIFQKIFEELKLGNPIIIFAVLTVLLLLVMVWVWQSINTPVILTPELIRPHPTNAESIPVLPAPASRSTPTATQSAFVPGRDAVAMPRVASFVRQQIHPLAFLAGSFHETHIFSR